MENKSKNALVPKVKGFFKKYGYYLLLLVCVAMLITVITISVTRSNTDEAAVKVSPEPSPSPGTVDPPIDSISASFGNPLANMEVSQVYSERMIKYTNNQFQTHKATDYAAAEGTDVKAMYAGKVIEVGFEQYMDGGYVVIKHDNEWTTVYKQLGNNITVKVGDNVTKGQVIGKVGTGYGLERGFGAHLHLEILQNNALIDPETVLNGTQK